ncbi:tetratricopeptide repeat protein [Streptomyces xantholiticus]|uniref:Tetratricopeptide repeat protein n=1 Tax=Streptomyces xantholiticus TaxID=68285 RepID=A0ABV1V4S1_9ACTN
MDRRLRRGRTPAQGRPSARRRPRTVERRVQDAGATRPHRPAHRLPRPCRGTPRTRQAAGRRARLPTGKEFAEVSLGLVARRHGTLDDAEAHFHAWLDWCRRCEGDHGVAFILAELGFIAEQRGDAGTARELHQEGLDHARRTGDPRARPRLRGPCRSQSPRRRPRASRRTARRGRRSS